MACLQEVEDIRAISDEFCTGGNAANSAGLSNMVWSFGQFLGARPSCLRHNGDCVD